MDGRGTFSTSRFITNSRRGGNKVMRPSAKSLRSQSTDGSSTTSSLGPGNIDWNDAHHDDQNSDKKGSR
ncbi:hypothetical protein E2C01_012123 [Portunus trituberculatus]|uniref:Uncharacterized protein n=1 Tax=Portunus trituberculatus TaxID=210409 RepID=A0A5B7DD53_PORTR|nr:hypothetical protein [Portunus trituberculatus]